jgi:hypothetical protein
VLGIELLRRVESVDASRDSIHPRHPQGEHDSVRIRGLLCVESNRFSFCRAADGL